MGSPVRPFAVLIAAVLLLLPGAAAWHWDDEVPLERYGSRAGDERVLHEAGECLDAMRAPGGPVCAVLYGHVWDLLQSVPLNGQRPADCAPDVARGYTGTPGVRPFWEFNQIVFQMRGVLVAYDMDRCGERPRSLPDHAPAMGLRVSSAATIKGHLHLSADSLEFTPVGIGAGPEGLLPSAGAIPCLTVRMTLETGRTHGAGVVIAAGETTKTILTVPEALGGRGAAVADPCPGAQGTIVPDNVTEFIVDLGPTDATLPGASGFHVHAEWYQWDGRNMTGEIMLVQHQWNLHAGPEYPNRVVIPLEPSLEIRDLHLQGAGGLLFITSDIRSPLGAYDIDTENIRIALLAPDGTKTTLQLPQHLRYTAAGDASGVPVRITHVWDFQDSALAPGPYTLHYAVTNWQHTEVAQRTADLWVASDGTWSAVAATQSSPLGLDWTRSELTLLLVFAFLATIVVYAAAAAGTRRPGP